ncbi:programmed cell death 1 ligand 1-like [Rhinatrema bivittatum]|uniref:programmed cell death 1 ligand 1-like n=1 Tax=Rhinatrema bivittatum TaxID=194408 RepID=UPI00112E597E|nr:programmed cell death 1 ligand 1-like [Rhinatrema bivittatum]
MEVGLLLRALLVSSGWQLFVEATPSVSTSDPVLRARLGYNITLGCSFSHGRSRGLSSSGHIPVTILWYFYYNHESKLVYSHYGNGAQPNASAQQHPDYHGRALMPRRPPARGNASLRLLGVRLADVGVYRCVVMDATGLAYAETSLEVYGM